MPAIRGASAGVLLGERWSRKIVMRKSTSFFLASIFPLTIACSSSSPDTSIDDADDSAASDAGSAVNDGGSTTGPNDAGTTTKDGGGTTPKGACKYTANATGLQSGQQAGGLAFHTYAPTTYDASVAHTVVVIMHGQDSDGTSELTSLWQPIADANQLVLLAPKGSQPSTDPTDYPNGANWSVNDLNNVQDLVSDIDDCYNVDAHKHILWGFSEGCFYGYLLGIGAATQFSGLAMGGANASFARENGYPPSAETWHIPVSHVIGTSDPNGTAQSEQDKADFIAAGSVFTLYEPNQGHTITEAQVLQQFMDLKNSSSP
jgi:poly(3-hydroxybutyrate) depolymerase